MVGLNDSKPKKKSEKHLIFQQNKDGRSSYNKILALETFATKKSGSDT